MDNCTVHFSKELMQELVTLNIHVNTYMPNTLGNFQVFDKLLFGRLKQEKLPIPKNQNVYFRVDHAMRTFIVF